MVASKVLKFVVSGIYFVAFAGTAALPSFFKSQKWSMRTESFAGGALLGCGLAYLLEDGMLFTEHSFGIEYPLAPALSLLTFVCLTCFELFTKDREDDEKVQSAPKEELLTSLLDGTQAIVGEESSQAAPVEAPKFGTRCMSMQSMIIYAFTMLILVLKGISIGSAPTSTKLFVASLLQIAITIFAVETVIIKDRPIKMHFWISAILLALLTPLSLFIAALKPHVINPKFYTLASSIISGVFIFAGCHGWSVMFEFKEEWGVCQKMWHYSSFTGGIIWMLLTAIICAI